MPRYIDADLIVERCQRQEKNEWNKKAAPISWADAYEQFETDISCIPTEDVAPVVRCKDCWHHNNCGIEQAALAPIGFFCALGERKDDAK